ncbi:MAG TPA: protein kinase [Gemmatimonadaceae bacterium]|nr:protein kinase [Gemmatimonadaceae bacterium]
MSTEVIVDRLRAALAGRYEVQRELGRGGFATVYLAADVRHGRMVAIKVLHPELIGTLQSERFLREIRVVAHLNHPHILPMLDSGEADGLLFFVMPYVEGETLRHFLDREKQLSIGEALRLTAEIADGLSYAHSRGLVHRDIKPENIMLSSGHAVVTDFGIGRAIDQSASDRLTYTGMATGSPAYMSPEQWTASDRVDGRADEYSLACVLYEMLVGETPFSGTSASALMARHNMSPVPSVRLVRPNVPEAVDEAIARAMEKIPADRYPTVTQFAEALAAAPPPVRVTTEDPIGALAERRAARKRTPFTRARLGIAAAVLLVGVLGFFAYRQFSGARGYTRLVVLPFENGGNREDAYLVDGITGELTNKLSGIGSLGVIARTSAVQYRNSRKTAREIGRELQVQYLVEGSVRRARAAGGAGAVHVNARLIRAEDNTQIWTENFPVEASDVTDLESRIAERVAAKLDVVLLEPEKRRLGKAATRNAQAYEHYLRGNEHYERSWSRTDVETAVQMYEEALELDPDYALAHARLAQAHAWMHRLDYDLREDRLIAAKRAADRAVALDPDLPDAHVALGLYYYWGRRNYDEAIKEFTRALELEPSNAQALRQLGNVRRRQGRFAEAVDDYRRSADLDPRSHQAWFNLGETLLFTHRYDEARLHLDRVTALAPEFLEGYIQRARVVINASGDLAAARRILREAEERIPPAAWRSTMLDFSRIIHHPELDDLLDRIRPGMYGLDSTSYHHLKGTMLLQLGHVGRSSVQFDSARRRLERMRQDLPDQAWIHGQLGVAYAVLKRPDDAVRSAERGVQLQSPSGDAFDGPERLTTLALVHSLLGNDEKAIEYYSQVIAMPSWTSPHSLRVEPLLARLRTNPDFQRLLDAQR